ncbi:hypothetical protein PSEUBRA_003787 [Kalmanozyma brasiliensis GHG001]|uniref:uncharacterized protein n=1 Tax=Kalmanozyma brasiliensis (strain GHG001) TaxID=1365824 RepID=UPI001CEA4D54|nr:uncharacterized protein PSEUBRA_003787 [Kalmanozyma brasiliensis GHG001]KAF6767288.1 hypothetical protein PSEUBRA_003787 [Kalmanozyma brasiliensis GHG001]
MSSDSRTQSLRSSSSSGSLHAPPIASNLPRISLNSSAINWQWLRDDFSRICMQFGVSERDLHAYQSKWTEILKTLEAGKSVFYDGATVQTTDDFYPSLVHSIVFANDAIKIDIVRRHLVASEVKGPAAGPSQTPHLDPTSRPHAPSQPVPAGPKPQQMPSSSSRSARTTVPSHSSAQSLGASLSSTRGNIAAAESSKDELRQDQGKINWLHVFLDFNRMALQLQLPVRSLPEIRRKLKKIAKMRSTGALARDPGLLEPSDTYLESLIQAEVRGAGDVEKQEILRLATGALQAEAHRHRCARILGERSQASKRDSRTVVASREIAGQASKATSPPKSEAHRKQPAYTSLHYEQERRGPNACFREILADYGTFVNTNDLDVSEHSPTTFERVQISSRNLEPPRRAFRYSFCQACSYD